MGPHERIGERFLDVTIRYVRTPSRFVDADSNELLDELLKQASLPEHSGRFRLEMGTEAI